MISEIRAKLAEIKDKLEIKKLKGELLISKLKALVFIILIIFEVLVLTGFAIEKNILNIPPLGNKVAVINFDKEVTPQYVNKIMDKIDDAIESSSYKELLFIMSSPGGSPTASEELSEYLKEINKKLPVTMYVQSIAASGGYYIASSIKPLIANKNAIVGSIGVIMPHYSIGELARKVGVEEDDLSAGEFKKPISLFSKVTPKNKEYLEKQILSPMYENFLGAVAKNRGIDINVLRPLAEGKIYMANSPEIKNILVDKISTLYFVKKEIRKKYDKKIKFYDILNESQGGLFGPSTKVDLDLNVKGLFDNNSGLLK